MSLSAAAACSAAAALVMGCGVPTTYLGLASCTCSCGGCVQSRNRLEGAFYALLTYMYIIQLTQLTLCSPRTQGSISGLISCGFLGSARRHCHHVIHLPVCSLLPLFSPLNLSDPLIETSGELSSREVISHRVIHTQESLDVPVQ